MCTLWNALLRRKQWERDLEQELRFHVAQRADDLVRGGMSASEAERQARLELGARETYREECREAHGLRWLDELVQDLRYAFRSFWKNRVFTTVAILSLALGVGANTVVFSVLNTLLLKPMPVPDAERILFLQTGRKSPSMSYPNYRDLRNRNTSFSGLAAFRIAPLGLDRGDGTSRVWGYLASGNYFETLGVKPALGRFFGPEEDRKPGGEPFAVLSYGAWKRRFGGDPRVVGSTIRIHSLPYTVVGVAPEGFHGTEVFYWPEIWVPIMMQAQIEGFSWLEEHATQNTLVAGRLRAGVSSAQAEANLNAIAKDLQKEHPKENDKLAFSLVPPGLMGGMGRAPVQAFLAGVMVLAGLVLLAACVNLAALLAARITDRYRELSIRLSLGAGRGRILRQLLTESLALSLAGGAVGLGIAILVLDKLTAFRLPIEVPIQFDMTPDYRVFGFTLLACICAGLLFGIAPARYAWRLNPNATLKGDGPQQRIRRRFATRDLLLGAQVAICCLLVTGCFVALRGLQKTFSIPLGFDIASVKISEVDLSLAGYDKKRGQDFQRRIVEKMAAIPGVSAAAFANTIPLSISQDNTSVFPDQETDFRSARSIPASVFYVSPGYFQTMGTTLVVGRDFRWSDDKDHPDVAVVNETFAMRVTGTTDALGKRFRFRKSGVGIEIIGVVRDGKYQHLTEEPRPALFRPAAREYDAETMFVVRSAIPDSQIVPAMRSALREMDPQTPILLSGGVAQVLGFALFPARAATVVLSVFGVLAIMLAITGIYGLAAYAVSRRSREIGIRVALGARPAQILSYVLGRTAVVVAVGAVVGLVLAAAGGRVLANVVYQASATEPLVLGAAVVTMSLLALVAALGPARRAVGVDPAVALRTD